MCKNTVNHEEMSLTIEQVKKMTRCIQGCISQWNCLMELKSLDNLAANIHHAEVYAEKLIEELQSIQKKIDEHDRSKVTITEIR